MQRKKIIRMNCLMGCTLHNARRTTAHTAPSNATKNYCGRTIEVYGARIHSVTIYSFGSFITAIGNVCERVCVLRCAAPFCVHSNCVCFLLFFHVSFSTLCHFVCAQNVPTAFISWNRQIFHSKFSTARWHRRRLVAPNSGKKMRTHSPQQHNRENGYNWTKKQRRRRRGKNRKYIFNKPNYVIK